MATAPKTHRPLGSSTPRQQHDKRRGSAQERGYDARWHKLRAWYVRQHPLCQDCEARGLTVVVDEVDHVIPINGPNDQLRLDVMNLRSRCKACHAKKTRIDGWIRSMYEHLIQDGITYYRARDAVTAVALRKNDEQRNRDQSS